jgi:hypothetical protein
MERLLSEKSVRADPAPAPAAGVRIEGIGVNPLDRRRVDVAVDLAPCRQPVTVEMAIVGPEGEEESSITVVENRERALDRIMHLRREASPGEYTLHVGVFFEGQLVHRMARRFAFPLEAE